METLEEADVVKHLRGSAFSIHLPTVNFVRELSRVLILVQRHCACVHSFCISVREFIQQCRLDTERESLAEKYVTTEQTNWLCKSSFWRASSDNSLFY